MYGNIEQEKGWYFVSLAGINCPYRKIGSGVNDLILNKDLIEKDGENMAKAIIQMKNHIIKQIHTFDSLIFDPWISEGGKERAKRNKECGFVQMIKGLAEISIDYTCKDQNKELESQSKKIVLRAREFSQWLKKEPIDQVIEAWLREQN